MTARIVRATSWLTHRAHRWATRLRWPLAMAAVWLWWILLPPTSTAELIGGLGVVVVGHRLLAPAAVRARRRQTFRARLVLTGVIGLLFGVSAPQAWADDGGFGPIQQGDKCRIAPTPETSGSGLTGILDPQNNLPMDGTAYGDGGFAGSFWVTYDTGCINAAAGLLLGQAGQLVTDSAQGNSAQADTMMGNALLKVAKAELAVSTGMRARAMNPDYFDGLDKILSTAVGGIRDLLVNPWLGLPIVILGIILLTLARRGNASESMQRILVALAGLGIIAFLGNYPLQAAALADQKIVGLQQLFDNGFIAKLPTSVIPTVSYCAYDYSQFKKPPKWEGGYQVIAGTACTIHYRPTLNPDDDFTKGPDGVIQRYSPTYYTSGNFYAETTYANLIIPYWEQGLIGTDDRSGPNYDLAMRFLSGQAMTQFDIAANDYDTRAAKDAPPGSIWCSYVNNVQTCGRSQQGGAPGRIMTDTEANYRDAIQAAGDSRYPYIQGKAGNRMSSGAEAVAAVTAATPMQMAAYSGVFAGRLLLRVYVIAGLIFGLGLILFPKLLVRIRNTVVSALATIVLLAAVGSLMTFLTLQLVANPSLYGTIGSTGGLVILAVISLLAWLAIRPMRRIGRMMSTAVLGDENAFGEARRNLTRRATSPVRRGWNNLRYRRSMRKALRGVGEPGTQEPYVDDDLADDDFDGYDDFEYGTRPENAAASAIDVHGYPQTSRIPVAHGGPRYFDDDPHPTRLDTFGLSRAETSPHTSPMDRPVPGWDVDDVPPRSGRGWGQADEGWGQTQPGWDSEPTRSQPAARRADWTEAVPVADTAGGRGAAPRRSQASKPVTEMTPIDAEIVDDEPASPAPYPAPRTTGGAFQITSARRSDDIFRPALEAGPRRTFAMSSSPTRSPIVVPRPDAQELIWRPEPRELPPAAQDQPAAHESNRPEIGVPV